MGHSDSQHDNLSKKIEEILSKQPGKGNVPNKQTLEDLLEEVNIYHQELVFQNQELIRIQEELTESKQDFVDLFDNAPVGYVVFNEGSVIQSANNAFALMVGVPVSKLKGLNVTKFIAPQYQNDFYFHKQKLLKTGISGTVQLGLMQDNKMVTTIVESNRFTRGEQYLVRCAVTNISKETKLQDDLQERVKELNALLKVSALTDDDSISEDELVAKTLSIVQLSFQQPELVGLQLMVGEVEKSTSNFLPNDTKITEKIFISGKEVGHLCVSCPNPEVCKFSLLKEEKDLMAAIAHQISLFLTKRRANKELKAREQYYRSILQGLHEDIVVIDTHNTVVDVNSTFLKNNKLTRSQTVGEKCFELLNGKYCPCGLASGKCRLLQGFTSGIPSNYVNQHKADNGEVVYMDVIISPIVDKQGDVSHMVLASRNITDLIHSQQATAESEQKHRLLVTQMPQGLALHEVVKDESGKVVDYRFLDVNSSYEQITGLSRSKLVNKTVRQVIPDVEQFWIDRFGEVATTGQPTDFEEYSKPLNRHYHVFAYSPANDKFAVIINDITQKKQMEFNLAQSEERYRNLFENSHAVMLVVDPQTGMLVDANPAAEEYYGWSRMQMKTMSIGDINVMPSEEIKRNMDSAKSDKQRSFVFKHKLKDGTIRDVEVFSGPISFQDKTYLYSFIYDITDKLKAERELKISEQRYRKLIETTKTIFWEFDPLANQWIYLSPQVKAFLGFSPSEWVNYEFWVNHIHPDDRDSVVNVCETAAGKGLDHEMEYRFITANGDVVWLREEVMVEMREGKPWRLRGTMTDITNRKLPELALKASEEKFQTLFNNLSVGVALINTNFQVLQVNPRVNQWFPDVNFNQNPFCYCSLGMQTNPIPCKECPVQQIFASGKTFETEREVITPQGKMLFRIVSTPIFNDKGEVEAVVEMMDSITERRKVQTALKDSEYKYRMLFETMEQGVVYHDQEGNILSANKSAQKILGLSLSQLQGCTSYNPEWRAVNEQGEALQGDLHPSMVALRTAKPVTGQVMGVFHPISKTYRWILVNAIPEFEEGSKKPFRVYATFTDITERKNSEQQIKEQKDFQETLMQTMPNPVFYKAANGRYIGCNKAFEDFMGYPSSDIIGKTAFDLAPKEIAQMYQANDLELLKNVKKYSYESIAIRSDGAIRSVIFDKAPLLSPKGNAMGIIGVITDITDRKKAEEEVQKNADRFKSIVRIFEQKVDSTNELLGVALDEALFLTGSKVGYIYTNSNSSDEFVLKSWSQHRDAPNLYSNLPKSITRKEQGVWQQLFNDPNGLLVNSIDDFSLSVDVLPFTYSLLKRFVAIPIQTSQGTLAIVGVAGKDEDYTETDLNQLKLLMTSVWGMVQRRADADMISKLSKAVEQSSASVVITNTKGIIEYVNPKFSQITGYSYQEAIGQNPRILNSGFHSKDFFTNLWRTIWAGEHWKGQLVNKKKNGELYWETASISAVKNSDGKIINFIAIKDDITELKMAEEAMRDSEMKLRRMIEQAPDGIMITDENGHVVAWNNAMESITRIQSSETLGNPIWDFHTAIPASNENAKPADFIKKIAKDILKTGYSSQFKTNAIHELTLLIDGQPRYLQLTVFVISVEKGNMLACFVRDVTTQKLAEEAMARSLEKEKELSELKSRFVSTVSHEFRTPLASIYSNSQLLQRYHHKWDESKKDLIFKRIFESVNMMTGMLENVSLIGKEQTGRFTFRPETINLNEFAKQMVEESHLTLNATNRVSLNIDNDFSNVLLDKVLLRHILINILSNAIKYSPNAKQVEFAIKKSKRFIEFYVHDFGVGIPQNDLNKIFEPFYRATNSESFSGTGLGMTIVKQCVDTHGGSMEVKSEQGVGTEVKVWLPYRPIKEL